ncbi:MAG TPA: cbb3-type cytochrome c oxidase subunit I, partial [Candidatus Sulfomarinibacteraceae bacterium]|nr:cbb3-type cytochrome c oxidase subunit I [Candidatus Sulfomarinibacteraceae bacterium]
MATHALTPAAVPAARGWLYGWLTTTDHKKIGIMYVVNSFIFFMVGGVLALVVRTELAQPGLQFLTDEHVYNEMFTMHATVMIFLFIIPMLAGLGNYVVPLQIGAPDMAFPRINALSLWMLPLAGILLVSSFFVGGAPAAGWTSYPPLSLDGPLKSPGAGQDLWIVSLILIGTSSILGSINFLVTIFKMRAPGMTLFRMPILVWTVLVTSVLVLMATPVITSAVVMLFIDRNYGGSFFDPGAGGSAVLYQNIFWFYSHPAVYVMVLPAMGVVSEVLPVFSRKPLFGYKAF